MYRLLSSLSPEVEVTSPFLIEGRDYYLVLDEPANPLVSSVLLDSCLRRHVKWHQGNRVAELRVDQFIGKIRIFDKDYDIRSNKFSEGVTGEEQIKLIVQDLDKISSKISFSYNSSVFAHTATDWDSQEIDYVYKLNYLHGAFFSRRGHRKSIELYFSAIKKDVFLTYSSGFQAQDVWRVTRVTPAMVDHLVRGGAVSKDTIGLSQQRVVCPRQLLSRNNIENQFLRFFFEYCEGVALRVLALKAVSPILKKRAEELVLECRRLLSDDFFHGVELPSIVSINSTVLSRRLGYREMYTLYITSLFSFRHIYQDFMSRSEMGLIDISSLYEIWCFYKVAFGILGNRVNVADVSCKTEGGRLRYGTTFENEHYCVSYNKTFSSENSGSYSTMLRPDISVFSKDRKKYYHFDAKYRVGFANGDSLTDEKTYKNDDVNKMHAYLDAIYNSCSSVVLYPGDVYRFHVRHDCPWVVRDVGVAHPLSGVGALPLVPGDENRAFSEFINKYFPPKGGLA